MTTVEALTLIALVAGPVLAVMLTLWAEQRRRTHDQKLIVFRMLISTRHLVSDPSYTLAMNLIPVEFGKSGLVMTAYKEFIDAAAIRLDGVNDQQILKTTGTKVTRLIYEMAKSIGLDVRETDLQTSAYAADGWVKRDNLLLDSQRASRDLVNVLILQARLMANAPLRAEERTLLGLPAQPPIELP